MTFGVDTDAMATAASRVGVAIERIDDFLARMRSEVDRLLSAWEGQGADAHSALHTRFSQDVTTINTSLRAVQQALEQTHSVYVRQEVEQNSDHVQMRNEILT